MNKNIRRANDYGRQCGEIASRSFLKCIGRLDDANVDAFFASTTNAIDDAAASYRNSGASHEQISAFKRAVLEVLTVTVQTYIASHGGTEGVRWLKS